MLAETVLQWKNPAVAVPRCNKGEYVYVLVYSDTRQIFVVAYLNKYPFVNEDAEDDVLATGFYELRSHQDYDEFFVELPNKILAFAELPETLPELDRRGR